ncbi:MAG: hypothetical protein AMXMBFR64_22730 [Myxococcales bacterium]
MPWVVPDPAVHPAKHSAPYQRVQPSFMRASSPPIGAMVHPPHAQWEAAEEREGLARMRVMM